MNSNYDGKSFLQEIRDLVGTFSSETLPYVGRPPIILPTLSIEIGSSTPYNTPKLNTTNDIGNRRPRDLTRKFLSN